MRNLNFATQFGESVERDTVKAFPFYYNFINDEDDNWDYVKGVGTLDNLSGIGINVPSGRTVQHYIKLDPDFNFKLLSLKYTTYYFDSVNNNYLWYEPIAGWFLEQADYQMSVGTPLMRYIDISISFKHNSKYLYGGENTDPAVNGGGATLPLKTTSIQGYDYGVGQLRTPCLLPKDGGVVLSIKNNHTIKDLIVGGVLAGMKVSI